MLASGGKTKRSKKQRRGARYFFWLMVLAGKFLVAVVLFRAIFDLILDLQLEPLGRATSEDILSPGERIERPRNPNQGIKARFVGGSLSIYLVSWGVENRNMFLYDRVFLNLDTNVSRTNVKGKFPRTSFNQELLTR